MARTLYAGRPGDTVVSLFELGTGRIILGVPVDATGSPVGVTLTVWDEPDGTQVTDLLAADGVTPITAVVVPSGEIQIPAFYGPDGVTSDVWLRDPEGDYTRVDLGPPGATGPAGGVTSVNGETGVVTLSAADVGAAATGHTHTLAAVTDVTASAAEVNILDGATLSTTELNYVDGVTSAIQTQLDAKAPLASPTFTGDPKAPTAAATDDDTSIATTAHVKDAIQGGTVVAAGNLTGSVSMSSHLTGATAVNAVVTATLTGNTTFTAATMPTVAAGTQFVMRITQDGTGSRTLTLTNIRKPGGALALSTAASAVDLVVFFYDGTNWYASLSGKAFAA